MTIPGSRSDYEIHAVVHDELLWSPDIDVTKIAIAVEDGIVTLTGDVDTNAERRAARRAALRVRGVIRVVDDIEVTPKPTWPVGEADLARAVTHALSRAGNVPDTVKAEVAGSTVILTGEVQWENQRRAARTAVRYLIGVATVDSRITLRRRPTATDAAERIAKAIARNALLDARRITVVVDGNTATLTGSVQSWAERHQAEEVAWGSPHVTAVENRIDVLAR